MNQDSAERPATPTEAGLSVRRDDTNRRSPDTDVGTVTDTREEIVLLFGVNQNWPSGVKELVHQLLDCVVLNPYVAKGLTMPLTRVPRDPCSRDGALAVEGGEPARLPEPLAPC